MSDEDVVEVVSATVQTLTAVRKIAKVEDGRVRAGLINRAVDAENVDSQPLVATGTLAVTSMSPAERARFLAFAEAVDDGEAATHAVVAERGYAVACDDGRACNV